MAHKSAFISLVGRPNTGKSTLLNALVGEKIAITSHHPNTTRHAIRGILTRGDCQLIFVDTPGLHKPRTPLGGALNQVVTENIESVDLILQCLPADEAIGSGDAYIARIIAGQPGAKKFAVVTKADKIDRAKLPAQLLAVQELAKGAGFSWHEIIPISARLGEQIPLLIDLLSKYAPEGPAFYPEEMRSDQELESEISELIREAAIADLSEELPHSLAVIVEDMNTRADKEIVDIHASIVLERDSQKGIVIGAKGERLKRIGSKVRPAIEGKLGKQVFLALNVKVIPNWQRDPKALAKLGFTPR